MPRRYFHAALTVALASGFFWQATHGAKPKDEMMELYGLFVDAVEQVEANYVRPVNRRELLDSALKGMLQNLDPHSQFVNQSEWKSFRKQIEGRYGGIGIQVELDPNTERLRVVAPMVGTPAYQAGVLAGDLILEIDGTSTEGLTPDKAVEVLTGRIGTIVNLKVQHEGVDEPDVLSMHRAIIDVPSVLGDSRKADDTWDFMLDPDKKIGYVRISSFIQNTVKELKAALGELKEQGMKALVLDLRDNPGGLLSAAVEVSDLFINKGVIVSTKGRNTPTKTYEAQGDADYTDFPMVVLVNQGSASASEIVSACLQDHDRAKVVGQRSFGKGSVQNILELEDGNSVLKLTVATYQRPSGKNIHRFKNAKESDEWGVSPNEGLELKLDPTSYIAYARGRRARDLFSNRRAKPKADSTAQPKVAEPEAKPKVDPEAAKPEPTDKPEAAEKPATEDKPEPDDTPDAEKKPDDETPKVSKARRVDPETPFVDTVRDKAVALLKEAIEKSVAKN